MLFSHPIQEVDLYRYLWDGAVASQGISPFSHSPLSIRQAVADEDFRETAADEVKQLFKLVKREPGIGEVLHRVHFPELPTIYPATSQAVFAMVDTTTPSQSSLMARVLIIKAWLIGFDIATLFTLIAMLRRLGKPVSWCIAYAWCPLLMKEVANSGHLDAIAVFLTTLTIYLAVRLITSETISSKSGFAISLSLAVIGIVFSLAIGAKLYPIVLAPLLLGCVAVRLGWRHTVVPAVTTCVITACLLWPMLPRESPNEADPSQGMATFLKQWEMNDFLFLILIENLKPTDRMAQEYVAWFSVVPSSVSDAITGHVVGIVDVNPVEVPFLLSRAITLVIFIVVAIWLAWRAASLCKTSPSEAAFHDAASLEAGPFCEAAFLTLAWFWLLAPTLNPWYWTWALPLLPFARGRAWIAVSGLVLVYYLRFWFEYHYVETEVWGTRYRGVVFYDLVITWVEFAPWMVFLFVDAIRRRKSTAEIRATSPSC